MPSTVIRRFAYDPPSRSLDVEFVSGKRYRYLAVPGELAERFRGAFAKGVFFNRHLRHHACEPLAPDAATPLEHTPAHT